MKLTDKELIALAKAYDNRDGYVDVTVELENEEIYKNLAKKGLVINNFILFQGESLVQSSTITNEGIQEYLSRK